MANRASDLLNATTGVDSDPIIFAPGGRRRGIGEHPVATIEIAAADNDDDLFEMIRVHSSDRILGVKIANDAITGGTAYDCGIYDVPLTKGGDPIVIAAKDDILFDGQSMSSARGALADLFGAGSNGLGPEFIGLQVWELLGLTEDSDKEYSIVLTPPTVGSAAGTITMSLDMTEGP